MKKTVIFYSWSKLGNTAKVGEYLADVLSAEPVRLQDKHDKPVSAFGWLYNGWRAARRASTEISQPDLADSDLVCLGTPVWAGNITPAMRTLLASKCLAGKKVILFATMNAEGGDKALAEMRRLAGEKADVLAEMSFKAADIVSGSFEDEVQKLLAGKGVLAGE
jgi:flavodoxin